MSVSYEFGRQANGPTGELAYNITFVEKFISPYEFGADMGCGSTPLSDRPCMHFDISLQPKAVEQVGEDFFVQCDASKLNAFTSPYEFDWIFSSHMVEDLPTPRAIADCLRNWTSILKNDGHIVLLLPDMQGGRYPTVAEGGNPSHRVDVGAEFINSITEALPRLVLVQMDTIPHDKSCTIDVVFQKRVRP